MQRIALFLLCLAAGLVPLRAAILERLSLDELTQQSTAIVRAKAVGSFAEFRGSMIYTHWKIQVVDRWKGPDRSTLEVLVPGGRTRELHQDVAGAPMLLTRQGISAVSVDIQEWLNIHHRLEPGAV